MGRPALLPCAIAMLYNTRAHQIDESIQLYPRTQNHCFAIADGQLMKGLSAMKKVVRSLVGQKSVKKLRLFDAANLMANLTTFSTIDYIITNQ